MSSATVTATLVYLFIYLFVLSAHNGDSYTRSVGSAVSDFGVTEPENYTKYNEEQIQLCNDFSFFLSFFFFYLYVMLIQNICTLGVLCLVLEYLWLEKKMWGWRRRHFSLVLKEVLYVPGSVCVI